MMKIKSSGRDSQRSSMASAGRRLLVLLAMSTACFQSGDKPIDAANGPVVAGPSSCQSGRISGEPGLQSYVRCTLASHSPPITAVSNASTKIYLDVSRSMQGFLDPDYQTTPYDFRRILDTLVLRLSPTTILGYGETLHATDASPGTLGNRGLYREQQTKMELALAVISRDSLADTTHLVIGDARRDNPDQARNQFAKISEVASAWIAHGGTFIVGVSLVSFRTVATDPSSCGHSSKVAAKELLCPLYTFAFVPARDAARVGQLMSSAFEHIFVWPIPETLGLEVAVESIKSDGTKARFEQHWIRGTGTNGVSRLRSDSMMSSSARLRVQATGENIRTLHWNSILLGEASYSIIVNAAAVGLNSKEPARALQWVPIDVTHPSTLVRIDSGHAPRIAARSTGRFASPSLFRFDLVHNTRPRWLDSLAAESTRDPVKTMGLNLLFIALPEPKPSSRPKAFLLIN